MTSRKEIKASLLKDHGLEVPESTVQKYISKDLRFSKKNMGTSNPNVLDTPNVMHQVKVLDELIRVVGLHYNVVYIDESAFDRNVGNKTAWAPIGQRAVFHLKPRSGTISLLAAISRNGFEGGCLRDSSVNRFSFLNFALNLVTRLKAESQRTGNPFVLYLDNASFHSCKDIVKAFKLLNINYLFAPAYCSCLNPIELFFQVVKTDLGRKLVITR